MSFSTPNKKPRSPANNLRLNTLLILALPILPAEEKLKILEQYFTDYLTYHTIGAEKILNKTGEIIAIRFRLNPRYPSPLTFQNTLTFQSTLAPDKFKYVPKIFETVIFQIANREESSEQGKEDDDDGPKVTLPVADLQNTFDLHITSENHLTLFSNPSKTPFTPHPPSNAFGLPFWSNNEVEQLGMTNLQHLRLEDSFVTIRKVDPETFVIGKSESLTELKFVLENQDLFPDLKTVVINSLSHRALSTPQGVYRVVQKEVKKLEEKLLSLHVARFIEDLLHAWKAKGKDLKAKPVVVLEPFLSEPINDFSEERMREEYRRLNSAVERLVRNGYVCARLRWE